MKVWALVLLMLLNHGCNSRLEISSGAATSTDSPSEGPSITFSGIDLIDEVTDSTLKINWTLHPNAVAYDLYNVTSGSEVLVATYTTSSATLTGLTPNTVYRYILRARDSYGTADDNSIAVSATTLLAPLAPTSLDLIRPASSPAFENDPIIEVGGVKSGDTIRIYTAPNCTGQIGSQMASGSTVNIEVNIPVSGTYTLYAAALNSSLTSSVCSTASLSYIRENCPSGYIHVPSRISGINDFCVMKFEAKCVGAGCPTNTAGPSAVPTSQPNGLPWVSIPLTNAKAACQTLGGRFDLISNREAMALAFELENYENNWTGLAVGSGQIYRGHSDDAPSNSLEVTDENDEYNGTGNSGLDPIGSGREQKRTLMLSNGEIIWDFVGNVWEWADWVLGGAIDYGPLTCNDSWTDFQGVYCPDLSTDDYLPDNPLNLLGYGRSFGLGRFYGGLVGATRRGGAWNSASEAGIYTLRLDSSANAPERGFRCVYRL